MSGGDTVVMHCPRRDEGGLSEHAANTEVKKANATDLKVIEDIEGEDRPDAISLAKTTREHSFETEREREVTTEADEATERKEAEGSESEGQTKVQDYVSEVMNHKIPTLVLLVGIDYEEYGRDELVAKILQFIQYAIDESPKMVLRGRTSRHFRIDYDPNSKDIAGIESRMKFALSQKNKTYSTLDGLLSPLLATNPNAFHLSTPMAHAMGDHTLTESQYRSQWHWKPHVLKKLQPITWDKRYKVVGVVLGSVRSRCQDNNPDSDLLCDPGHLPDSLDDKEVEHIREWSLFSAREGFGRKLQNCFKDKKRSAEDYEDRIERLLYLFKKENGAAVFGRGRRGPRAGGPRRGENVSLDKIPHWKTPTRVAECMPDKFPIGLPAIEQRSEEEKGDWLISFDGDH